MPDYSAWGGVSSAIDTGERAVRAWNRIQRDPISIQVRRNNTLLDAQTVRVGIASAGPEIQAQAGMTVGVQTITVYGVKDHPDTDIADTDLKRGDRFFYNGKLYEVTGIVEPRGEVQAFGEVRG